MPEILVIFDPSEKDEIHDRIPVSETNVGTKVDEIYQELFIKPDSDENPELDHPPNYSIEIRHTT